MKGKFGAFGFGGVDRVVIPREGVESLTRTYIPTEIAKDGDPERGS